MEPDSIISHAEALQILANDLLKSALAQHAAELKDATETQRQEILEQIDRNVRAEIRRCARRIEAGGLLH